MKEQIKSWKAERIRRKKILTERQLHKLIVKDIEQSIKQRLRDIISGQSAQQIAEITERINKDGIIKEDITYEPKSDK